MREEKTSTLYIISFGYIKELKMNLFSTGVNNVQILPKIRNLEYKKVKFIRKVFIK
jgi:hypothetical protein